VIFPIHFTPLQGVSDSSTATAICNNHAYATASEVLYRRKMAWMKVPLTSFDFDNEWERLRTLCGSKTSANQAWGLFQDAAIGKLSSTESEFSNDLLDALVKALGSDCCQTRKLTTTTTTRKAIQIKNKNWGFTTTQAVVKREDEETETDESSRSTQDSNNSSGCPSCDHHACVIFDESGKNATDVMALVELTMSDCSCGPIQVEEFKGTKNAQHLDLFEDHSIIGQNIIHILDRVIPDQVRNNVQPKEIPIMILAAKRGNEEDDKGKKRKFNDGKLSFVRGDVHIPKGFGDSFAYSVSCFGDFNQHKEGIAAYINTLCFGADAAEEACKHDISKHLAVLCSSEHKLLGSPIPFCKLIASPIPEDSRLGSPTSGPQIYRAELFEAVVSRQFFSNIKAEATWISDEVHSVERIMNNIGKQSYVVVKVSSAAVHNTVMKPSALEAIFQKLKCKALSDVLIGVWRPSPSNLVTIMKDLRKDHYRSLEPDKIPDVTVLWNSFATLVKELLLPFARQGVVHCGIRPGWDHTASLMWNNNAGEGIQLRLIDYESLCVDRPSYPEL